MRATLHFWLTFLYMLMTSLAQTQCPTTNIQFLTQDSLNKFAETHPNCTNIQGSLTILGDQIVDLSPLSNLETIGGTLNIQATNLENLNGFSNLESIGKNLYIYNNEMMKGIVGFTSLTSIGNELEINGNPILTNVDGFSALTMIGGSLNIRMNGSLANVDGFRSLKSIGGAMDIYSNALTNVDGFSSLTYINKGLEISFNHSLTNVDGFSALKSMDGFLKVYTNGSLKNMDGFRSLKSIGQNLYIGNNGSLTSIKGLEGIDPESITELDIRNNPKLSYCKLGNLCTYFQGSKDVNISGNAPGCESTTQVETACLPRVVSVGKTIPIVEVCQGTAWEGIQDLKPIVTVTLENGARKTVPVNWNKGVYDSQTPNDYRIKGDLIIPLGSEFTNAAGLHAELTIRVLPPLEVQAVSGVIHGDTLHLEACLPPRISKDDLDLGIHQRSASVRGRVFSQDLPAVPESGCWKLLSYEYKVTDYCGQENTFQNYLALYDLTPPEFRNFPMDVTIPSADDLPAVSDEVRIIDICRYVVWDSVTTTPILDNRMSDTLAFVRRWSAEDESGNRSFRDQMIYVGSANQTRLGGIVAHVTTESDLVEARFPGVAGTDNILFTLYQIDTTTGKTEVVDLAYSGNWQGSHGKVYFTPVHTGTYRIKVDIPQEYSLVDSDSLFSADGWSDNFHVRGSANRDMGTLVLIPASDTTQKDTLIPLSQDDRMVRPGRIVFGESFSLYPNPTLGQLHIAAPEAGTIDYSVYNRLGRLVEKGSTGEEGVIDLGDQMTGIYFVHLKNEKQQLGIQRILVLDD